MFLKSIRPEHRKFLDRTLNETCVAAAFLLSEDRWVIEMRLCLFFFFPEDGWAIGTLGKLLSVKY
jgi:hypothetical protein